MPPPTSSSSSGQGAAVATNRAAITLRSHAVDTLAAAGHLGVLGCGGRGKKKGEGCVERVK